MPARESTPIKEIVRYPNGVYYYRKGTKEQSLKTKDWDEAVKNYTILSAKAEGGKKAARLKIKDVFDDYLAYRESLLEPSAKEELALIRKRKKEREKNKKEKQA